MRSQTLLKLLIGSNDSTMVSFKIKPRSALCKAPANGCNESISKPDRYNTSMTPCLSLHFLAIDSNVPSIPRRQENASPIKSSPLQDMSSRQMQVDSMNWPTQAAELLEICNKIPSARSSSTHVNSFFQLRPIALWFQGTTTH